MNFLKSSVLSWYSHMEGENTDIKTKKFLKSWFGRNDLKEMIGFKETSDKKEKRKKD